MRNYRLLVLCDHCDRMHPTGSTLGLNDGLGRQTIAKAFKNKRMPPMMSKL
jgi:hypothetical protein